MEKQDLLKETLRLMNATQRPVNEVCRKVGVTPRWYYMLLSGEIHDPGVRKIQRLHEVLTEAA